MRFHDILMTAATQTEAAAGAALPVILNGTFTGSDNWTDVDTGGTADAILTGTNLLFVGGTNAAGNYVEQSITGLSEGQVITIQYEIVAGSETNPPLFTLGGGTQVAGDAAIGVHTADVTVGASGTNLQIKGSGTAVVTWTMDNISITAVA